MLSVTGADDLMKTKKILALILTFAIVFCCAACTGNNTSSETGGDEPVSSDASSSGTSSGDASSEDTSSDNLSSDTSSSQGGNNSSSGGSSSGGSSLGGTSSGNTSSGGAQSTPSGNESDSTDNTAVTLSASGTILAKNYALAQADSSSDWIYQNNPDRGFRMEVRMAIDPALWNQTNMMESLDEWRSFYRDENPRLAQTYFYLTGLPDQLPQYAFDRMQAYFDGCRQRNIKIVLRFAYQHSGTLNYAGDGGEATQKTMLAHMSQLGDILEKNKDVIHVVQIGFIGAWGEWHSYTDHGEYEIDEVALVKGILNMVPDDLFLQMRYIVNHREMAESLSESEMARIGFHADGVNGVKHHSESYGTKNWAYKTSLAALSPQDGEMMWGGETYNHMLPNFPDYAFADNNPRTNELKWSNIVGELAEHCFTSFSLHHSYRETEINDGIDPPYTMYFWQSRYITSADLEKLGLFYSPGWFTDKNGKTVRRSQFDYVRDYLGYRVGLNNFSASGTLSTGKKVDITLNLSNYGFSAAFNITSGFAVLDENNNVVSFTKAGDPSKWYSRTPGSAAKYMTSGFNTFPNKELLSHDVSANITLPNKSGKYKIAFYAESTNGQPVYFVNNMEVVNGYHILANIEVA